MIVFLDTGILGLICSPKNDGEAGECKEWLYKLLAKSVYVVTSDLWGVVKSSWWERSHSSTR